MSDVTNALRQFIQGMAAGTPGGAEQMKAEQEANRLKAETDFRNQTLKNEQQRLALEEKAHQATAEFQQHETERQLMLARVARAQYLAGLATKPPNEMAQLPGITKHAIVVPDVNAQFNPDQPGSLPATTKETGIQYTIPSELTGGEPATINGPTQEDYLKNLAAEERAKKSPELEMLQERLSNSMAQIQARIDSNQAIMNDRLASAEKIAEARNQSANDRQMLEFMKAIAVANINQGNTGDFNSQPHVDRAFNGEISENDANKEFKSKGQFNAVRDQLTAKGGQFVTDKQRDIAANFGPAANALQAIHEFNTTPGMSLADKLQKQNEISQALGNVERNLMQTRVSGLQNGQITKAYTPNIINPTAAVGSVFGGKNTQDVNADKEKNFARYMYDMANRELGNLSPEQRSNILTRTGLQQYLPYRGHQVGDVVNVGGKNVKITKLHNDGQTFDGEEVK